MDSRWLDRAIDDELSRRGQADSRRRRRLVDVVDPAHIRFDGRILVNFASNNYLGLTHHPNIVRAAAECAELTGAGSGASALISGYQRQHAQTEAAIAAWKGAPAAVLLPSGYQAAHAAIQTLAGVQSFHRGGIRFLVDKLGHASLLDAIAASGCAMRVFPHNHIAKLKRLLDTASDEELQVVVTESIFSMAGDAADLEGLVACKRQRPFILVLDEAHASGVYGQDGAGLASERGVAGDVDIAIVTFSKALGVVGGAVCASERFCDALVNWGRAYIYSTAVPPMIAAAIGAAVAVVREEPWRRERVRELARKVRAALSAAGARVPAGDSPIVPVILGEERRTMAIAEALLQRGLLVGAVRPPTVARGSSRLRLSLNSEHSDEEVERLVEETVRVAGTF